MFGKKSKQKEKQFNLLSEKKFDEIDELETPEEREEFQSFFADVLKQFPSKTSTAIMKSLDSTKDKALQLTAASRSRFDSIFDEFLADVDQETRKKCHTTVHVASLTAAIIGLSPIPFSDAFLLVPVQLTMMARLHKIFGQSWSESLGKSLTKELVVVSLGRSAVGNILKFIPVVGTISGGAVNAVVAMAITESLGWVTVKMLNDGEDIFDQVMSFKGQFDTLFKAIQGVSKKK
ncbi:YcjF family protein [Enterococcus sp. DIV0660C]|uniref:YcjF family protein n=1 Tax=Enterococcus sp. DIV0660C TaxID=2230880 RepID=UPI001A8C324F|nr:YcjF family protein [Enterococcus sp. DIV0660C]MBO0431873.1 YcjF family protein [Enterococcus sp. DIV0660C]